MQFSYFGSIVACVALIALVAAAPVPAEEPEEGICVGGSLACLPYILKKT